MDADVQLDLPNGHQRRRRAGIRDLADDDLRVRVELTAILGRDDTDLPATRTVIGFVPLLEFSA